MGWAGGLRVAFFGPPASSARVCRSYGLFYYMGNIILCLSSQLNIRHINIYIQEEKDLYMCMGAVVVPSLLCADVGGRLCKRRHAARSVAGVLKGLTAKFFVVTCRLCRLGR